MNATAKQIVQRLGPVGLARALDDLLDTTHLVRLANTCGLKYPGMRTQSQKRERLVADLVDRATKREDVRKAILRMLDKESAKASKEWGGLEGEEKVRRLCDDRYLRADGNVGLHLFLLARSKDGDELEGFGNRLARERLLSIATNGAAAPEPATRRDETRLRRQLEQRERKIRHLDGQLTKSREATKATKSDLIQKKGELAESRMLAERLRRELAEAKATIQVAASATKGSAASEAALANLTKIVKKLTAEQKTLAHRLGKLAAPAAPRRGKDAVAATVAETVAGLGKQLAQETQERRKESVVLTKQLDALRSALGKRTPAPAKAKKAAKRARSARQTNRVGVFIDVQNVYYAARQLKGKLDFDALLQAAVQDRRLIKATAYVVESKETDQSQFIAMLQKRAIEVQRKTLRVRADGSMKGDWDMELALDILDAAPKLDVVVLVSGDGDFTSLVKRVKGMGPRVEVIAFPRNAAKSLVEAADHFQPLDRKFMIYTRPKVSKASADKKPPKG